MNELVVETIKNALEAEPLTAGQYLAVNLIIRGDKRLGMVTCRHCGALIHADRLAKLVAMFRTHLGNAH